MDNPDMITVAVIGDGESETGPTATAWHAHKVGLSQEFECTD
jgi:xylulose-5-phosphate/fructose-6-phosphate phosphoketolase